MAARHPGRATRPLSPIARLALAAALATTAALAAASPVHAATLWVDDTWTGTTIGNDPDGGGPAGAFGTNSFATIQSAIDAAAANDTINVRPGNYNETAAIPSPPACPGDTVGLYFPGSKPGLTVQGVTLGNVPIVGAANVAATVTTVSNLCFGPDGIFVEGDGVTIAGLQIGTNTGGQNKTIEVIGDAFTLRDCDLDDPQGSVYINDFAFDVGTNTSSVQTYTIQGNIFRDGLSLDLADGAGFSGPASGRQITGNAFFNNDTWPSISFNGSDTGVPWFVHSVGGAVIQTNTFTNTNAAGQHIRARGTYDNTQFDWASYWNDNVYNKSVVVGAAPPANVRTYSYTSGSYTFNDVRRIGAVIQGEVDHAVAGDTVLVGPGAYDESPNLPVSLTLKSDQGNGVTTINLQTGPTYTGALTINGVGAVTVVDGFTIVGRDAACPSAIATSNIYVEVNPDDVTIRNNVLEVGAADGACSTGDDGFGVLSTYSEPATTVASIVVEDNVIQPLGSAGTRAFYINPGTGSFSFLRNQVTGKFNSTAITQAGTSLIEDNTIDGLGLGGAGLGAWGYPDANLWGKATVQGNFFTGLVNGFTIYESNDVVATCNRFVSNGRGVRVLDGYGTANFDPTTIDLHSNVFRTNTVAGVDNQASTPGNVLAENNYWNSGTGPNPPGSGDKVLGAVDAIPFSATVPACVACTTAADCNNGLACDGAETCNAGVCTPGTPVTCAAPTQCQTSNSCQEPSGTCVATPKPDGILCSDGQSCSVGDTCQSGVCQPGPGGDADNDGDCNNAEVACGCNPNDGSEVCALPNRLVGLPGSGAGEVLLNWYAPTVRKVTVATDDSCKTSGVGLCVTGRCQAGKIADLCATDADCYEAPNYCRVVVNYGDVPDNKLYFARFGRTDVPGFVTGTPSPSSPIAVAAGCSKKVDVLIPSRRSNNLKLKAKGTVDTRPRTDIDALQYRR